jgi:hypothetical protein
VDILKRKFGVIGQRLHEMGLGMDDSPVAPAKPSAFMSGMPIFIPALANSKLWQIPSIRAMIFIKQQSIFWIRLSFSSRCGFLGFG